MYGRAEKCVLNVGEKCEKNGMKVWSGFVWLRMGTCDGLL
jgi:hypothetical protein